MVDLQTAKLLALASIAVIGLSFGMAARPAQLLGFAREPATTLKALTAMFVVMPLAVLALGRLLPVPLVTLVTMLALYLSPTPPIFIGKARKVGAGDDYAIALFVLAAIVCLGVAPLGLTLASHLLGQDLPFNARGAALTLLLTIIGPLLIGMALAALVPAVTAWRGRLETAGSVLLAVAALMILASAWPVFRQFPYGGTLPIIIGLVALGLAAGHWLGDGRQGNRAALASATAMRHPGVGIALASAALPGEQAQVAAVVLIFLATNIVLGIAYGKMSDR